MFSQYPTADRVMRIWLTPLLFLLSAVCVTAAQPPATPPDPGKFVIRPGGKGAEPVKPGANEPTEKAGFIIIRPGGKGTTTFQVGEPKPPAGVGSVASPAPQSRPPAPAGGL